MIQAFNYPSPLFSINPIVEENWKKDENGVWIQKIKRKIKLVKTETIKNKAQRIVKNIGSDIGIISEGKILIKTNTQEYKLNPAYFGIPENLPDGTEIDLGSEPKQISLYKNLNLNKMKFEKMYYTPEFWGDGCFLFKGPKPEHNYSEEEISANMELLLRNEPTSEIKEWNNIISVLDARSDKYLKFAEDVYINPVYISFIEKNTIGKLTYKCGDAWFYPVFVYSDSEIVSLVMPVRTDKMFTIQEILPYRASRRC